MGLTALAWLAVLFNVAPVLTSAHALATNPPHAADPRVDGPTARTASIYWDRVPIRDALARATQVFEEPIFLDRRVDPLSRVTLRAEAAPLDEVIRSVADAQALGSSRLNAFRYIGPVHAASQLRTIVARHDQDVAKLTTDLQSAWRRETELSWSRLTEPRQLVVDVARRRGWTVANAARIPHDLWPAGRLPMSTGVEQLTVLLIGFDLTFAIQADRLELRPLEPVTIARRYRLKDGPQAPLDRLRQELPASAIRVEGKTLVIDGRVEDHELWLALSRGQPARPPMPRSQPARQVYTLRVEQQPVDAILRQLAERLNWVIEVDEHSIGAAGKSLGTRVSFAVENRDQDELLRVVLQPAGLDYRRDGERIIIMARSSSE